MVDVLFEIFSGACILSFIFVSSFTLTSYGMSSNEFCMV